MWNVLWKFTIFCVRIKARIYLVHSKGHTLHSKGVVHVNIASEPAHSSLAQRIAKVRNCMLVELSTGVSVTDKDLFVSLCQIYEQNSVEESCTTRASSQNALYQAFSLSHLTPENILLLGSERDTPSRQHRIGFSIIRWPNLADWDDWGHWDKSK